MHRDRKYLLLVVSSLLTFDCRFRYEDVPPLGDELGTGGAAGNTGAGVSGLGMGARGGSDTDSGGAAAAGLAATGGQSDLSGASNNGGGSGGSAASGGGGASSGGGGGSAASGGGGAACNGQYERRKAQ